MSFITSPGIITPPLTAGGAVYGTGSQAKVNSAGTVGQVLTSAGAGVPTWTTPAVPAAGGSMMFLSTVTAVNAATADVETTFNSTYDNYVIMATGFVGISNGTRKYMLLKIGSTYKDSGYKAICNRTPYNTGITVTETSTVEIPLFDITYPVLNPNELSDFIVYIRRPSSTTTFKTINFLGFGYGSNTLTARTPVDIQGGGVYQIDTQTGSPDFQAITGVRFRADSGNISGTFRLYGIANS